MTFRSRARTDNSLLRSNRLDEPVAWIGGLEPVTSFGELVLADGPRAMILAQSLSIPLGEEDAPTTTLNKIFLHLGVSCTHFVSFSLLIHQVTITRPPTDSVSCRAFEGQYPADVQRDKPWMTPIDAPLYLFLAYLTMFVYSSVVL